MSEKKENPKNYFNHTKNFKDFDSRKMFPVTKVTMRMKPQP